MIGKIANKNSEVGADSQTYQQKQYGAKTMNDFERTS